MTATTWHIPDCYLPALSGAAQPSHEAFCVLNVGDEPAHLDITLYFEDAPVQHGTAVVSGNSTRHLRTDRPGDVGVKVPREVPYAARIVADRPVTVQYSRLDTSDGFALITTIAHAAS